MSSYRIGNTVEYSNATRNDVIYRFDIFRQILPASLVNEKNDIDTFDKALGDGKPIIVYVHGNSGTRASPHRVHLYSLFQSLDMHIITFDYRSNNFILAVSNGA